MKTIFTVLITILVMVLAAGVLAITLKTAKVNSVITEAEFLATDFSNLTATLIKTEVTDNQLIVDYSIPTVEDYKVTPFLGKYAAEIANYNNCRSSLSQAECLDILKQEIKANVDSSKDMIKSVQDEAKKEIEDKLPVTDYSKELQNFVLTTEDIN